MPADHRNQVLQAAQKQVQRLYDQSPQAMYLFLDDRVGGRAGRLP
jgi:hypothetical protein